MRRWATRHAGALLGLALGVLLLGPVLLRRGYVLVVDMVFVPDPPWWGGLLGLDGRVPRAVPSDAVATVLGHLLPSDLAQRVLLLAVPVLAAAGGLRLVRRVLPDAGLPAGLAAAALCAWNPYVGERLALGQWAVLLSYAALPWVVVAALDRRRGAPLAGPRLLLWLAVAAVTPSGGLVALGTGLAVVAAPTRQGLRDVGLTLAAGVAVAAPWALPALLAPGGLPGDPAGVDAFAARADTPLGLLASVLTLGGVWDPGAVPGGRDSAVGAASALLLLGLCLAGLLRRRSTVPPGLLVAGGGAVLAALAGALPGTADLLRAVVADVPALALLRDGSRLLGPAVLLSAVGLAATVTALLPRVAAAARAPVGVLAVLLPLLVLPGLALGLAGRLAPVAYPPDWARVRAVLDADPAQRPVLSLPWSAYRRPPWNRDRVVLDPALKAFGRPVVADDALVVAGVRVAGEDPVAGALDPVLRDPEAPGAPEAPVAEQVAALGIGWVLVARQEPGAAAAVARFEGLALVVEGPSLALYAVADPAAAPRPGVPAGPVLAADLALGLALAVAAGQVTRGAVRRRRRSGAAGGQEGAETGEDGQFGPSTERRSGP